MTHNANIFEPPTAEQLSQHLEANPPVQSFAWGTRLPVLLMVAGLLGLSVLISPAMVLLPWLGLIGLMVFLTARARAAQELRQRVTRAWELAMIRRYREALGRAWELLPACQSKPELHGRVVTIIAHILGELGHDEAAEVAYGYLLDRLAAEHPLALRLQVQQAVAALGSDRLADADEALRKLRGRAESSGDPTLSASYRMARLAQDVRTGHYADAAARAEQTADALRPLGVEAGYGHGLLALCFQQLARHDPASDDEERRRRVGLARRWWDSATLLIPAAALVFRYPQLGALVSADLRDKTLEPAPEGEQ